jgi:replicative DNA helicase
VPLDDGSTSLPANVEAEQSLLGTILINNAAYGRIADSLTVDQFASAVHGRIFAACGRLIERGSIANPATLYNMLADDPALKEVGAARYLAQLVGVAGLSANLPHYAAAIRECWQRRELIAIASSLDQRARAGGLDGAEPSRLIAETETAFDALLGASQSAGKPEGLRSAADGADAVLRGAEAAYRGGGASGVPSGLTALDRLTGGWQKGDLIYIGKRPSMGGTAFLVTLALNAMRAGFSVAMWSIEMSAERLARRLLAWLSGVSTRAQRAGQMTAAEWQAILAAREELRAGKLAIDDASPVGVSTLRRRARQMQQRGAGLDLVLIDYLQLLRAGDGHEDLPLRDAVPRVSGQLRDMAKELDVPIVALSQLTPDIDKRENKRPTISDVRWSHDCEQDAAIMGMLFRAEFYLAAAEPQPQPNDDPMKADKLHAQWSTALAQARGRAEINIVKNRDDALGVAHLGFDPIRSWFFDDAEQGRMW